jgi:uncharacterized protein YcbK (DUF882 family)
MMTVVMKKYFLWSILILGLSVGLIQTQPQLAPTRDGAISLFNTHTQQTLKLRYLDDSGNAIPEAVEKIAGFICCPVTGKIHEIDLKLIETLDQIQDHFGTDKTLVVISGYRSPELNAELIATGHRVVSNSQHIFGKACDFKIEGVELSAIRDFALKIKAGGVGYYPGLWVHVDSAEFRTW